MNEIDFETRLRSLAGGMKYPPTPDIAGSVAARLRPSPPRLINRTLARSLILVAVLLLSLMLIPPVRAAVLEFLQIGAVRIFRAGPTVPAPTPQQIPATMAPSTEIPITATPVPTKSAFLPLLEQMAGEVSLAEAQEKVEYPILLPAYPAGLGKPDRVFVQDPENPMTILVWLDPQDPSRVRMSLHLIPPGNWVIQKFEPTVIEETTVNGHRAIWAMGPYPMILKNGNMTLSRLIKGHVLIWEETGMTYRLETDASLEEAVRIAESLQPVP